jgi:diketogulonate reductase-like aldo/keto reductase
MKTIELAGGVKIPVLGVGTWNMAEDTTLRAEEIATLQASLDAGLTMIDTAEMYAEGAAEALVGEALAGRRQQAFIVSKVYPHNAAMAAMAQACERSLQRLRTDCIDLYLLHWRGTVPLEQVLEGLLRLQAQGKIRYFGVSNLDTASMRQWCALPGGADVATNQILYNLTRRAVELDLLPFCRRQGIPVMAYSPLEQGALLHSQPLIEFAQRHGITPAHAALGWVLAQEQVFAIPKTSHRHHLQQNLKALEQPLSIAQCAELEALFPAPTRPEPLAML